jgi:hypothetical protein
MDRARISEPPNSAGEMAYQELPAELGEDLEMFWVKAWSSSGLLSLELPFRDFTSHPLALEGQEWL